LQQSGVKNMFDDDAPYAQISVSKIPSKIDPLFATLEDILNVPGGLEKDCFSAKTGKNVELAFHALNKAVLNSNYKTPKKI
jgi:hypothetical protein